MKTAISQHDTAEQIFARRVCALLDEGVDSIDESKLERLAFSRKLALRAQRSPQRRSLWIAKAAASQTGRTLTFPGPSTGKRLGLGLGAAIVVFTCLVGIFQFEQQRRIEELADIDSALLSDDLPISAYADHGFNAYLKQNP